jgi:hypothetical protein
MKLGGYNPDYVMGRALIDAKGAYRLTGRLNDAARLGVGVYTATAEGLQLDGYAAVGQADLDADGRFSLEIAAGLGGPRAVALGGASNTLMTRELVLSPGGRRPEVTLNRLDAPAGAPSPEPLSAAEAQGKLAAVSAQALLTVRRFLRWSEVIGSRPNEMTPLAEELDQTVRGDPDTLYYSGYYDLAPNEALMIELPDIDCPYRALQAVNHWLEPITRANLNHTTWRPDSDGRVRVVVARRDPGRANWLNVGESRRRGALLYRTVGAETRAVPTARLIDIG